MHGGGSAMKKQHETGQYIENNNKTEYAKHIPFWLAPILYFVAVALLIATVLIVVFGCKHSDRRKETECIVPATVPVDEMPKELQTEYAEKTKENVLLLPDNMSGTIPEKALIFSDSYVMPHSNERLIVFDEAVKYTAGELYFAYYEIFARHHVKFDEPVLKAYFSGKNWYEGTITPFQFMQNDNLLFNDYEIYNKDSIYEAFIFLYQEEE